MELTQPLPQRQSWWRRLWDLALAREEAPAAKPAESVSFAEVVWAHAERQKEVVEGVRGGPWEREYRRRLGIFEAEHGRIAESYWCRFEASGVALTEKLGRRRPARLYRRDLMLRLHAATDWRTADAPAVARCLHRWETAGIKATEILRETGERIALSWIFAASARLLACVDRTQEDAPAEELQQTLAEQEAEQEEVRRYYQRAGDNAARIVFFRGMVVGTALLAFVLGLAFFGGWWLDWVDPRDEGTYTIFVVTVMGAAGAILSVMTRMAKENGFSLDFEVGRKSVRFLGGLRPWIGALFALALYVALKSSLVEFVQITAQDLYFYATLGFVAGFSERRAKVLLDSVGGGSDAPKTTTA